jgi:hypothetical protein
MATALKKKEEGLPADLLADYEGMGTNFSQDEVVYPFVSRIQTNSPQLIPGDAQYVEDAKPGHLFHTATRRVYKELNFVPLKFQQVIIQWRDRDSGGGFVAAFEPGSADKPATHKVENVDWVTDDPQSYLETNLQYICMFFDGEDSIGPAVLSCNKSQLKYARRFNVALQSKKLTTTSGHVIRAPIFSHVYSLSTVQDSNSKGSWFSYRFGEGSPVTSKDLLQEIIGQAKTMKELEQVFVPSEDSGSSNVSSTTIEI